MLTHAPAQTSWPLGQAQFSLVHVAPVAQTFPHAPQFCSSEPRSTQRVGAAVGQGVAAVAGHWHVPSLQTSFASGQA